MEHALLDQSPACHWILDADGRFRYGRGNTLPLFQRPAGDLPGLQLSEVLPDAQAEKWATRLQRVLDGETVLRRERWGDTQFTLVLYPLRAPGGTVFAGGSAQDVTTLDSAERELRDTTMRMLKLQ